MSGEIFCQTVNRLPKVVNQPRIKKIQTREDQFITHDFPIRNSTGVQNLFIRQQLEDNVPISDIKKVFFNAGLINHPDKMHLVHHNKNAALKGFVRVLTLQEKQKPIFTFGISGTGKRDNKIFSSKTFKEEELEKKDDLTSSCHENCWRNMEYLILSERKYKSYRELTTFSS